jgi:thiol-disulfide isomerase/thioredoxin
MGAINMDVPTIDTKPQKKNNTKYIAIVVGVIIFAAIVGYCIWYFTKEKSTTSTLSTNSVAGVVDSGFENYQRALTNKSGSVDLVLFYANWCAHCPPFKEVVAAVEYVCQQLGVSVTTSFIESQSIPRDFKIEGFPSLFIHYMGSQSPYKNRRTVSYVLTSILEVSNQSSKMPSIDQIQKWVNDYKLKTAKQSVNIAVE